MRMERERKRERQRQRETERDRDRETKRERETERETERRKQRERERQRDTDIEREMSCINCIITIIHLGYTCIPKIECIYDIVSSNPPIFDDNRQKVHLQNQQSI